jgi:hypothetical protein
VRPPLHVECDSEIIAVYLAEEMSKGRDARGGDAASRSTSSTACSRTSPSRRTSSGVAKDELAAKPLVLYESDDLVALASEEIAIRRSSTTRSTPTTLRARGAVWQQVGERAISYDARGLAEPVAEAPRTAVVEDGVATSTRAS